MKRVRAYWPTGYVVLVNLALLADFLTMRTAKDRGSDAGRRLLPVRGNPERPEA